jgi:hypothetical protein
MVKCCVLFEIRIEFLIFIALKNPSPWPGFEPATFGSSGLHTNHYTIKATEDKNTHLQISVELYLSLHLHRTVLKHQTAFRERQYGREHEDRQGIAIKMVRYLPRDEINGEELRSFYCLCQTRGYVQ